MAKRPFVCDDLDWASPCRDFTPSYEDMTRTDYRQQVEACREAVEDEDDETFAALQCKREAHVYVPGGRSQQRYTSVPYPRQPWKGGPSREQPDWGDSGATSPGEKTKTRWAQQGDYLHRRTQGVSTNLPRPMFLPSMLKAKNPSMLKGKAKNNPKPPRPLSIEEKIALAFEDYGRLQHPDAVWPFEGLGIQLPDTIYPLLNVGMPKRAAELLMRRPNTVLFSRREDEYSNDVQLSLITNALGPIVVGEGRVVPYFLRLTDTNEAIKEITVGDFLFADQTALSREINSFFQQKIQGTKGDLGLVLTLDNRRLYIRSIGNVKPDRKLEKPSSFAGKVKPGDEVLSVECPSLGEKREAYSFRAAGEFSDYLRTLPVGSEIVITVLRQDQSFTFSGAVQEGAARKLVNLAPAEQQAIGDSFVRAFFSRLLDAVRARNLKAVRFVLTAENKPDRTQIVVLVKGEHSIWLGKRGRPISSDYRTLTDVDLKYMPEILGRMIRKEQKSSRRLPRMNPSSKTAKRNQAQPAEVTLWGMNDEQIKQYIRDHGPISIPWKKNKVLYLTKDDKLIETTEKRAETWQNFKRYEVDEDGKRVEIKRACEPCPPCEHSKPSTGSSSLPNPYTVERHMIDENLAVLHAAHQMADTEEDFGSLMAKAWDQVHLGARANPRRKSRKISAATAARHRKAIARAIAMMSKSPRMSLRTAVDRAWAEVSKSGKRVARSRRNPVDYTDTTMVRSALDHSVDYDDPSMVRSALMNPYEEDTTMVRSALSRPVDFSDSTMVRSALMNPAYSEYSEHHPVYEQEIGQFSTSQAYTHGIQPMNRRNPRKSRKARNNPIGEFRLDGDYSEHHPVYEQFDAQFSTSEPWTHGIQPMNRRNPMTTRSVAFTNPSGHQANAAEAMSLFRSGQADSLKEAWAMVKGGGASKSRKSKSRKSRRNPQFQVATMIGVCPHCQDLVQRGAEMVPTGGSDQGFPEYIHAECVR